MLKTAAMGLIVLASVGMGYACAGELQKRYKELMVLRQMFLLIQGEIQYGKTPIAETFEHTARRLPEPFCDFLDSMAKEIMLKEGQTLAEIFAENVDKEMGKSSLSKSDLEQLKAAGAQLGYLDIHMQQKYIELYLEQLEISIAQAREEYGNKAKVYHCLGVMGGLFLVLILI